MASTTLKKDLIKILLNNSKIKAKYKESTLNSKTKFQLEQMILDLNKDQSKVKVESFVSEKLTDEESYTEGNEKIIKFKNQKGNNMTIKWSLHRNPNFVG